MDGFGTAFWLWLGITIPLAIEVLRLRVARKSLKSEVRDAAATIAQMKERYSVVVDADAEAASVIKGAEDKLTELEKIFHESKGRLATQIGELEGEASKKRGAIADIQREYREKKKVFDALVEQVAIYDERLSFAELGIYEPHFDFDTSDQYQVAIQRVRDKQKAMVKAKTAVVCHNTWQVDGSAAKGKVMTDRNIRLTLRAFNNECEASISNVRWNNANAMEKRILNAQTQIDKQNQSNTIEITNAYVRLKLEELHLVHEYREKMKAEREDRAEMARAAREEQKLLREMEEAEREEAKYQKMLEKARRDAAAAVGVRQDALQQQVQELERQLEDAHSKAERAQAMAERTRTGYVYVISNIGSFGPDFVKIGLTRRLDPTDRIRELGDASVPFLFDTHAIIYSDDAPALERALHNEFASARVNAMNFRREFFRVSLDQVENAVSRLAPGAPFFKDIEAQEFQETLAMRRQHLENQALGEAEAFPAEI